MYTTSYRWISAASSQAAASGRHQSTAGKQRTSSMLLLLSIDGTDRRTHGHYIACGPRQWAYLSDIMPDVTEPNRMPAMKSEYVSGTRKLRPQTKSNWNTVQRTKAPRFLRMIRLYVLRQLQLTCFFLVYVNFERLQQQSISVCTF